MSEGGAPPRGTRPRNRRALIRDAATELFAERGYANVSVSDIAAAVNVGASAVYRHYAGKADLLFDAIDTALEAVLAALPASDEADLPEIAHVLAAAVLDNRVAGVLMQRESRNLSPDAAAQIRKKRVQISAWLTTELSARRPELSTEQAELLSVCASDALTSVSFHHLDLPRPQYERLLADLGVRVMRMDPVDGARETRPRPPKPATRAEEILDAAVALFAEHGYTEVSIDDIGAAVGIAGPSVYNHFPSKQDILVDAMVRGHAGMRAGMASASAEGRDPADVLRHLSDHYVDLTLDHPSMVVTMISELVQLKGEARGQDMREMMRGYVQDWVTIARAHHPSDDAVVTRIKVQAAQMMANDVARTPRLRRIPGLRPTVREAAWLLQQ
ncbi:helix-turn-helix domain-containing protein [Sporichthya sp.]|uniref:TetR/AcrR family transcriptional regulator n=1 Tax=Sporichthya sp. TaxID=65475 RepID=UPI0018420914|nr:helix-turn-helix domain-containing protein [Sporichthya sp.]MBA3742171.1 TetR/AcrR family transcriptional regulator [Sporichthya sp.]